MKKILSLVLVLVLMGSFSALADLAAEESIDLQNMEISTILELKSKIDEELYNRGGLVVVPPGQYVVGEDIASGSYDIVPYGFEDGYYWSVTIYLNLEAAAGLINATNTYLIEMDLANRARGEGKEVEYPKVVDLSQYIANPGAEGLRKNPVRITLKDGQIMEIEYAVYGRPPGNLVISKATPLFIK